MMTLRRLLSCLLPVFSLMAFLPAHAGATTYTVTDTSDSATDTGSLRYAVIQAQMGDTITFASGVTGTIVLSSPLVLDSNITLVGPGATALAISGGGSVQVFSVTAPTSFIPVSLSGLTIENGSVSGGNGGGIAVASGSILALTDCVLTGNQASEGSFGSTGYGGGVYNNNGRVTLTGCTLSSNSSGFGAGGGLYNGNNGTATLLNCIISGSSYAVANGSNGSMTLTDCTFTGNTDAAFDNTARATLTGCIITGTTGSSNSAFGGVGAVCQGTTTLSGCVISNTTGIGLSNSGTATISGCTLTGNTGFSGSGIVNTGALTVTNSMFQGNSAASTNPYITPVGGALYNNDASNAAPDATATVVACTFTGNSAPSGGGAIAAYGGITLVNDILYGDTGGEYNALSGGTAAASTAAYCDIGETLGTGTSGDGLTDNGHNLNANPQFVGATDLALQSGSPALGHGATQTEAPSGVTLPTTDITGATRPSPPAIGAFDANASGNGLPGSDVAAVALTSSLNSSGAGQATTLTATVTAGGGSGPTGTVTFVIDGTLETPVTLSDGTATFSSTDNLTVGTHIIAAVYSGDDTYTASTSNPLAQTVNAASTVVTTLNDSGLGSLRSAVLTAESSGGTVTFQSGLSGTITLSTSITIQVSITVQGPGAGVIAVSGGDTVQVFFINGGTTTLSSLSIEHGNASADTAGLPGSGGGIFVSASTTAVLSDCIIMDNQATVGGGIYSEGSGVTLTNCVFTGNVVAGYTGPSPYPVGGGAFYNNGFGQNVITNCTFTDNSAPAGSGGAIGTYYYGEETFVNDILYGDTGGEIFTAEQCTATNCDIGEALGRDGVTDEGGNIEANPKFVNPPSDVSLQSGSPCLGAGTFSGAPATDITGAAQTSPPSIGAFKGSDAINTGSSGTGSGSTGTAGDGGDIIVNGGNPSATQDLPVTTTLTVTATSGTGTPTGTATFSVNGGTGVTEPLVNGVATYTTSSLPVGTDNITATYDGDSTYTPFSSPLNGTVIVSAATTTPTVIHTFQPGLQMVALDNSYPNLAAAWSAPANQPYDTWNGSNYVLSDSAMEATPSPGTGFWVDLSSATSVYGTDQSAGIPTLTLSQGWNLIGDPFSTASPLSAITVTGNGQRVTGLANANADALLYGTLYTFPAGATAYTAIDGTASGASLQPFTGYWLYAFQGGETLTMTEEER